MNKQNNTLDSEQTTTLSDRAWNYLELGEADDNSPWPSILAQFAQAEITKAVDDAIAAERARTQKAFAQVVAKMFSLECARFADKTTEDCPVCILNGTATSWHKSKDAKLEPNSVAPMTDSMEVTATPTFCDNCEAPAERYASNIHFNACGFACAEILEAETK